jgi:N-acetylmuramic acid 6-phosphate etherase
MTTPPPPLPATEGFDPRMESLDSWAAPAILDALWEGQMSAVAALRPALPALAAAAEAAVPRLAAGGRLAYAGAGTSGRLGVQDGAELMPTFDWPAERLVLLLAGGSEALLGAVENAEDDREAGRAAIAAHCLGPDDVLLALAASGATPYTVACAEAARAHGALTIGIANAPGAPLLLASEHAILIETGPEAIAGSTRMKAGTAQKAALTVFSTLLMVRLGRVWRGRMVDMQARNDKLRRRALRMLRDLSGADEPAATRALEAAGGKVKTAVLVLRGLSPMEAEAALARHGGHLRAALEASAGLCPDLPKAKASGHRFT